MVRINGEEVSADNRILQNYLEDAGYSLKKIAVEVNGWIIPKAQYSAKVLMPGDSVEIVHFVGGG
ncbi:sulfur carrier protein ThiS [Clostridium aminobutyricum]|uniref:Sulfur carrier protein ThiS n=1 Tax=Clostridium aminobutyricum TaxID=33953 RepID=A0A939D7C0_CLOAM|nr:sulfur carrier protein ThiS [Clostridium aminobutyricum]MBN7772854.1 sulfur carrier protein ThiS [Clostridium aminobutyricum]